MPSPGLTFLQFVHSHGDQAVRHLLDLLNAGRSYAAIAAQLGLSAVQLSRIVKALTDKRYILKQDLLDWLESDVANKSQRLERVKRERAQVLRLAAFNGRDEE